MGCITAVSKYLLFLFNFVIFVCSILLIVFGAIRLNHDDVSGRLDFDNFSVSELSIALGVFIGLISFFGCCGAIKENSCLLTTYAIILLLLFIAQVVIGILAFVAVKNGDLEFDNEVKDAVKKWFDKAKSGTDNEALKDANKMQREWECCGVEGPQYWGNVVLPKGCCGLDDDDSKFCTLIDAYKDSCAEVFSDKLKSSSKILGGIAIGFAVVELVGAIFAFCVRARK